MIFVFLLFYLCLLVLFLQFREPGALELSCICAIGDHMETNKRNGGLDAEMMSVHEVADYLRLSEAKVYRMANSGFIPALRIGKTWRFKKEILEEWIRRETRGGGPLFEQTKNNKSLFESQC